jgi:hypothetical protein
LGRTSAARQSSEQKQAEDAANRRAKAIEQASKDRGRAGGDGSSRWPKARGDAGGGGGDTAGESRELSAISRRCSPTSTAGRRKAHRRAHDGAVRVLAGRSRGYRKGESRIEMKIVDSGFNQMLFTPFAMFMQAGYEKETSSGYEKSTTVGDQPGWEKWNTDGKDGEVNAFVAKRFILTVEGRNVDDIKVLHDVIAGRLPAYEVTATTMHTSEAAVRLTVSLPR